MSIGERIREIRKQQGLSIDELAYKIGKNRTTIYRYENGDIENLPLGILDGLADALNTTPAYLMGWEATSDNKCGRFKLHASPELTHMAKWIDNYGINRLSNEECEKVMEYAKFLISMRER